VTGFERLIVPPDWNRSTDSDWADALAGLPLFARVAKRRLRKVAREARFAEFAPGDTVVAKGEPADSFYVVLGGKAAVRGKPRAGTLTIGDHFGELALLDGEPRSATVVAADELHVMRLPRRTFLELVDGDGAVARTLLAELGTRIRRLEQQQPAA
jgi:CRP/FNR family cyclic AMP-dependent transcriptional regulator